MIYYVLYLLGYYSYDEIPKETQEEINKDEIIIIEEKEEKKEEKKEEPLIIKYYHVIEELKLKIKDRLILD
jgi:hypothetical protein